MTIEDVESHAAKHRIAQCGHLLENIAGGCFRSRFVPGTPFIDHQLDMTLLIKLAHYMPMTLDESFHALAFAQQLIPVDRIKVERIALAFFPILSAPAAQVPGIVMKSHAINSAQLFGTLAHNLFQEAASPLPVIDVWTRSDEQQLLSPTRHPSRIPAKFNRVFLRCEIPTASPRLVTDSPKLHTKGIPITGGRTLVS